MKQTSTHTSVPLSEHPQLPFLKTVHRSLILLFTVLLANNPAIAKFLPTCPTITVAVSASPSPGCVGSVLTLSASASGGEAPYLYTWSGPAGFSATTTNTSASTAPLTTSGEGDYHVMVTDANGCTSGSGTGNRFVSVYTIPVLSAVATPNPVCTGNTLSLTAGYNSGGTGVNTYTWTGPNSYTGTGATPTISDITSAAAGIYSVTATDVTSGCIGRGTTGTVSVITNTVTLNVSSPIYICSGSSAAMSVSGASTYDWNPTTALTPTTGASVSASPTSSTNYVVTGHVGNCYNSATIAVVVLTSYSVTATTTSTNGTISESGTTNVCSGTDKTYTITPSTGYHISDVILDGTSIGNTPPFTIHNVLAPHSITASFAPDCTAPSVSCTGNITQNATAGACSATVTYTAATATGTSPAITYSQNSGTSFSVGVTTVTATATNGCGTSTCNFLITVNPNTLSVGTAHSNVSCNGGSNGSVTTSISGGTGSYSYSWTGGASGANPTALAAGTYTVTVTDNGCSAVSPVSAVVTITQPDALAASSSVTNPLCNGGTGTVVVSATGGSGAYTGTGTLSSQTVGAHTYTVTDANSCTATTSATVTQPDALAASSVVTNPLCNGGTGSVVVSATGGTGSYTGTGTFSSQTVGAHTYTVTDANSCTATTSATVTQPDALSASSVVTNPLCNGGTGSVVVSATGGTGAYTGTGTLSSQTVGAHTYTVTDANSCTATTSATVTQPDALAASSVVTNPLCNGGTGTVVVSATGGSGAYTGTGTLSSQTVGAHTYTVTDANSCTATTSATVTQPSVLVASSVVTNPLCNGGTGTVVVSATGGSGAYTGTGTLSSQSVGAHTYTVTDANSCTATTSATVIQPDALSASSSVTNPLCNGGTGTVVVSATGGSGAYTGTGTFSSQSVGAHTYTVTDANSCTATTSATVTQPSVLAASSVVTNPLCNGGTGTVVVSATGGSGTYTGTGTLSSQSVGAHTYTVTDANGCSATTSATVTQPGALSISATSANISCNSANGGNHSNGSIATSVSGGTGSYSYSWTGGATGANPTGLATGTYSVTVSDNNSCTASTSATVGQPSAVSVTATPTNISCNNANGGNHSNGSIATSVSGGTGSYTYAWSNSSTGSNLSALSTGTYSVTVTDANSCTKTATATISQPSAVSVTLTTTNVSCGGTSNGSVAASTAGGTSGYTYLWSNSQTGATNTGLATGTYSVTVTDANSCTTTASATVSQSSTTTCTITGSTSVLGNVAYTYSGPSGMSSYNWSISGGDHICDSKCHHYSGHSCGSGCDHYNRSCTSSCHHHGSHSCSNNHTGDHHCNSYCHHHSGHSCNSNCDHNGHSCTSDCHHHSSHRCNHQHCGNTTISGSKTGASVTVVSPCCATTYTLTLTATNSTGCTSSSNMAVTVTPSATITVYSSLYTTGSGYHPSTTKSALAANLKVFTRSTSRRRSGSQSDYETVWNGTSGLVSNIAISSPVTVTMGGGPAYQYTITVPAKGHYLVVGQSTVSSNKCGGTTCTLYTGKKIGGNDECDGDEHGRDDDDDDELEACSNTKVRFHSILKDQTGRCREADTHEEHGSLMLVISPMELAFDDSVAYLPVVYESVEGDWSVSVSAEPPYGFYTEPSGELSTSVTDSVMNAVQFNVIDTGSEWTFTQLTHQIQHKGEDRVAHSKPVMVNERTNKPVELNITPNPATDQVKVTLPRFEGRANICIYNLLGQKVSEKPIEMISGGSATVDITSLVPGVYMITAENTLGKASGRLIKTEK